MCSRPHYTEGFDFYIEQPDNSEQQAETQTLQAQISQERQMYQDQLNELRREQQQLRAELNEGNRTYRRLSDFKKGQWLRQRPKLEADISQLTTAITHLRPLNLHADTSLKHLQVTLQAQKVLVSGNFVGLN
jgi:prefoldin subunit 5